MSMYLAPNSGAARFHPQRKRQQHLGVLVADEHVRVARKRLNLLQANMRSIQHVDGSTPGITGTIATC